MSSVAPPNPPWGESRGANGKKGFLPEVLDRTVIAIPLLHQLDDPELKGRPFDLVIDVNLDYEGGREAAWDRVQELIKTLVHRRRTDPRTRRISPNVTSAQYVFASLDADAIRELVRLDTDKGKAPRTKRAIYHIWPDFPLKRLINKSVSTVKSSSPIRKR